MKCPKTVFLLLEDESQTCKIFQSTDAHAHEIHNSRIPDAVQNLVKKCIEDRIKSNDIMKKLREHNLPQIKKNQLASLKKRLKAKTHDIKDLGGIVGWCNERKNIPDDPDQVFCLKLHYLLSKSDQLKEFRAVITTTRLLDTIKFSRNYFLLFFSLL